MKATITAHRPTIDQHIAIVRDVLVGSQSPQRFDEHYQNTPSEYEGLELEALHTQVLHAFSQYILHLTTARGTVDTEYILDEYLGGKYLDVSLKPGVLGYLRDHFHMASIYLGGAMREAITQAPAGMFLDEVTIRTTTIPTIYVIELDYLPEGSFVEDRVAPPWTTEHTYSETRYPTMDINPTEDGVTQNPLPFSEPSSDSGSSLL